MPDKIISMAEVKKHKSGKSVWLVIHNDVYDVTKFMRDHPGGEDAIQEYAGKDGTKAFEDVGHSEDARAILNTLKIGSLSPEERKINTTTCCGGVSMKKRGSNRWKYVLLALAVIGVGAFAYKKYKG